MEKLSSGSDGKEHSDLFSDDSFAEAMTDTVTPEADATPWYFQSVLTREKERQKRLKAASGAKEAIALVVDGQSLEYALMVSSKSAVRKSCYIQAPDNSPDKYIIRKNEASNSIMNALPN